MTSLFSYDAENRLIGASQGSTPVNIATYVYDGDGKKRISAESGTGLTTLVWDGDDYLLGRVTANADGAVFVSQSVPASIPAGTAASVSVTFSNSGTNTWTPAGSYEIGFQAPQDDTTTWGLNRVALTTGDSIAPGASKTFSFTITAPATAGNYGFQWRMIAGSAWFGEFGSQVYIPVV